MKTPKSKEKKIRFAALRKIKKGKELQPQTPKIFRPVQCPSQCAKKMRSKHLACHLRSQLLHGNGFEIVDCMDDIFQLGNGTKYSTFHLDRFNRAKM